MDSTPKKINLLIGFSGSVATIKYRNLIQEFLECPTISFSIKVVATQKASFFLEEEHKKSESITFSKFPEIKIPVFIDKDEWNWKQKGDSILHIELKKWANVFLIAPLSANTLAKISSGICDNLLVKKNKKKLFNILKKTCIARAWDFNLKPNTKKILIQEREYNGLEQLFIVAPAMNTFMFEVFNFDCKLIN